LAQIGTTAQVVPLLPFPTGNLVDAAFIESFYESSGEIKDIGSPTSASSVAVDECIRKSGRTTGLTFGRVRVVNLTVDVGPYECSAK